MVQEVLYYKNMEKIKNKIFNKDCLVGIKKIPNNSLDLVIADPSYCLGKDYENNSDKLDSKEYLEWTYQWIDEIIPKLKSFLGLLIRTAGFTLRSIEARKEDEKTVKVELFVDGAGLMIGENGENIFSWEDVLNQWLRKNSEGLHTL